ncbi:MAG: ATP-binding protein [Candidatus Helarchaeota archaeon]|nr:ATP-binding protein [Candidatus Helarchaeota archaeon]
MKVNLRDITNNYRGYEELISFYHNGKLCTDNTLEVDMSHASWVDANLCAPLGAVLFSMCADTGRIQLQSINYELRKILDKNGFIMFFNPEQRKATDTYLTTIQFQRFERSESYAFKEYMERHFVGKGIPQMSQALHRKFRESIFEIFENAVEHSKTEKGIFACGQFFPKKRKLDFSIADLGVGIRNNLYEFNKLDLPAEKAIMWALEGNNTTRQREDGKPGGFGLKLIREFIRLNRGKIQIVSDAGYWCFVNGEVETKGFSMPFPGTVVNIEINTADTQSYKLASEIDSNNIF